MIRDGLVNRVSRPRGRFPGRPAFPLSVIHSLAARRPELLGFALTPWGAVESALSELNDSNGTTWKDQIKARDASYLLNRCIAYFKMGSIKDNESIKAAAAKLSQETKETPHTIITLLMMLKGITQKDYAAAYAWLTGAGTSYKAGVAKTFSNAGQSVKEGAIDTLHEAAEFAKSGIQEALNAGPWYMKPKVIMPLLLLGVGFFYWDKIKGFLPKKAKEVAYKMNPVKRTPAEVAAAKMYETFTDLPAKRLTKIPKIDCSSLAKLGDGLEIMYRSKKWTGKNENYLHKFGRGVKMYSTPDGKTLVLAGGKMKLTSRGIEN